MRDGILCGNCNKREVCTRQCKREERKKYKIKYPDKIKEQKKRYRIKHRKLPLLLFEWLSWIEHMDRKYKKLHLDEIRLHRNEVMREANKRSYYKHRERKIAAVKAHQQKVGYQYNIITKRISNKRRKHRIRELEYTLTEEQWNKILQLQGYKCQKCKQPFTVDNPATRDHIIPMNCGGGLTRENTQALCRACNSRKQDTLDKSNIITWMHTHQQPHLDIMQISAKSILTPAVNEQV